MNLLQKELLKKIYEQEHSIQGEPQYEAYGDTYSIVGYSLTPSEEYEAFKEQKNATIFDINECECLNWDIFEKYWDRLMENDKLLYRVKRILMNMVEAL